MDEHLIDYEKSKGKVVLKILKTYLKMDLYGKRILEIGCSTGALMELLEQKGADVYGVDVESHWSRAYYYREDKRILCDLQDEDISYRMGVFDLIVAQEVIEHIKKPYDFLANVRKLLKPEGKIFITTPNLTGITAIVKGKKWCGTATGGHVLLYTQRSLDFLMGNCGFRKLKAFTNLVPIVYQHKYPWLWCLNWPCMRTKIGSGIMALYMKLPVAPK